MWTNCKGNSINNQMQQMKIPANSGYASLAGLEGLPLL